MSLAQLGGRSQGWEGPWEAPIPLHLGPSTSLEAAAELWLA